MDATTETVQRRWFKMTREEAISWLTDIKENITENWSQEVAIDMAIEALSADAVPTVIRAKTFMRKEDFDKWAEDIKRQGENVICIPCDAEVVSAVQGEWVHDGQNFKGGLDWCHCSVCGQKTSTNGLSMYNFCPNCGARMEASK